MVAMGARWMGGWIDGGVSPTNQLNGLPLFKFFYTLSLRAI